MRSIKSFTLVELTIVIAIIAMLGTVGINYYLSAHRQTILRTTSDAVVAFLYEAKQNSIAQHEGAEWGVRFSNPIGAEPFYALFQGPTFINPIQQRFLDSSLDFSFPAEGQNIDIVFSRITGRVSSGQFRRINIQLIPNIRTRSINISSIGTIWQNNGEIGLWRFDEASGTSAIDNSGYGRTGSLTATTWGTGRIGGAIDLNGTTSFVSVPHDIAMSSAVFDTSSNFTLEAWAFPRIWANWASIINKADSGCWSHTTNGMWASDQGGFTCAMGIGPGTCNPTGSIIMINNRPDLNIWHHVVCTADGTTLRMFVNGVQIGNGVAISTLTHARGGNTQPITIGRRCVGCGPSFNGLIDDVRIYDRALSPSEIRANFRGMR